MTAVSSKFPVCIARRSSRLAPLFRLHAWIVLLTGLLCLLNPTSAEARQRLEVLARVGPWPVAANLVAYRGRLWFSTSVKGRNHNSADIWSLDPATGDVRYERHLFSQDAGRPLVFNGLLYWPYEDPRVSLGYGAIAVTNGSQWRELSINTARIFHVHSLIDWGGTLVAVTSAWRAGLQVSDDGGASWSQFYDHPTPPKRIARLKSAAVLRGRLYFRLRDPAGTRLVRFAEGSLDTIADWPEMSFHSLTVHHGALYGIVGKRASAKLWRRIGRKSEMVTGLPDDGLLVALHAGRNRLWALFAQTEGGYVVSSQTGTDWRFDAEFDGGTPLEMVVTAEQILVAGAGTDGKAVVWGLSGAPMPQSTSPQRRALPMPVTISLADDIDWQQQADKLRAALQDPANFRNHGRGGLRDIVRNIIARSPPPEFLPEHLSARMPGSLVSVIGGESTIPARHLGQWILLWAMASNAQSKVPVQLLKRPWQTAPKGSEKYFDPLLAALFTIARNRQNDRTTIAALITRLQAGQDPLWLTGDIIGALNAITGQRFGYSIAAWSTWWQRQQSE